jgi:Effector protein/Domain of unknown function (DUF4157)
MYERPLKPTSRSLPAQRAARDPAPAAPTVGPAALPRLGFASLAVHPPRAAQSAARPLPNRTGLSDGLKRGVEALSGVSLDGVKVHYNSARPARLGALAYAQGRDIHLAPGQEHHLPHEAWHLVQQAQGRVRPTMQLKDGVSVNDEFGLEREADVMGARALAGAAPTAAPGLAAPARPQPAATVQRFSPTVDALATARANLKPADFGVVHPKLRGIRVRRDPNQPPEHYFDLLADTRASVNRLAEKPVGGRLLTGLEARTQAVHPGQVGNERNNPLTVVDIRSGRGLHPNSAMSHRVRFNPALPNPIADIQRGYRYDGQSGAGIASRVNYDESRARRDRFIDLGHELVHAYRSAHGHAVSPPSVSPKRGHSLLNPPTNPLVAEAIDLHAQLREEFETVGLTPTPRVPDIPTEAGIRAEHGAPPRTDYSGLRPGGAQEQSLRNVDEATDDRSLLDKYWHNKPSPVTALVKHLED